jgi:hypothetical protein
MLGITAMSLFPFIALAVVLLLVADMLRWKIVVGRELRQRGLVRSRPARLSMTRVTPARGFRLIETCICERDGKQYRVIILNRGWLSTRPSLEMVEV